MSGGTPHSRRLFVALRLPLALGERLAELARAALGPARSSLSLVGASDLHVTLAFLGSVAEERLAALEAELARACADAPGPRFELGAPGVFPERGRARVLWLGLEERRPCVGELHRAVLAAVERAGLAARGEEAEFRAHLTLARVRRGKRGPDAATLAAFAALAPRGSWVAGAVELVESRLERPAQRYRTLAAWPLS